MKLEHLERAFESIGARLRVGTPAPLNRGFRAASTAYSLDIGHDREGQFFALRGDDAALAAVEISLLNKQADDRHLLILVKNEDGTRKDRFLCGHDEREWFVAAVPGTASTVVQAKEALKPAAVRHAQARKGLNARKANTRHNAAFRRQGEWFFLPVERPLTVDHKLILRNEPLSRGAGSKPHLVEQIYRTGGEVVYVSRKHPRGITQAQYNKLIKHNEAARNMAWQQLRRNPAVYARGAVRHPDHDTIVLHDWCRVLMNEEHQAPARQNLAFLD